MDLLFLGCTLGSVEGLDGDFIVCSVGILSDVLKIVASLRITLRIGSPASRLTVVVDGGFVRRETISEPA